MGKRLSDTAAIAAKPVLETANPNYSGFTPRRGYEYDPPARPARDTNAGYERPTAAIAARINGEDC